MKPVNFRQAILLIALLALALPDAVASGIYSAELRYYWNFGTTYTFELVQFVDQSIGQAPSVVADNGDGTPLDTLARDSAIFLPGIGCDLLRRDVYLWQHTYSGAGSFTISCTFYGRDAGIVNIPNSGAQGFCTQALLVIGSDPVGNSSARFTESFIATTSSWSMLLYDPLPVEPDQDSLIFELVEPFGLGCSPVAGYVFPVDVVPGSTFNWVDPATGVFQWYYPLMQGSYVIALRCTEYRNGSIIGQVTRDVSICVNSLPNSIAEAATNVLALLPTLTEGLYTLTMEPNSTATVQIYDSVGRMHRTWNAVRNGATVDMRSLGPGIYTVLVNLPGQQAAALRTVVPR